MVTSANSKGCGLSLPRIPRLYDMKKVWGSVSDLYQASGKRDDQEWLASCALVVDCQENTSLSADMTLGHVEQGKF